MRRVTDKMFLESAIHCVAEMGLENTRTKQIADNVGLSEATLFRAFKTKNDVLNAAFLYVDKKISAIPTKSKYRARLGTEPFENVAYDVWYETFRYLTDHPEETVFLIRFRYSSLYSSEMRSKREAYNGSFDRLYDAVEGKFGTAINSYRGFLINYVFEMTLCFAEKIVTGRIKDNAETEKRIWSVVYSAIRALTATPDPAEA